jgi:hypothetical protein
MDAALGGKLHGLWYAASGVGDVEYRAPGTGS